MIFLLLAKRQVNPFNTLHFRDEGLLVAFLFYTQHLALILKSSANARSQAKSFLGKTLNGTMAFPTETHLSHDYKEIGDGPRLLEKATLLRWPKSDTRQP